MTKPVMQKVVIVAGIGIGVSISALLARYFLFHRRLPDTTKGVTSVEVRLEVPRKFLGYIIGKRGTTIKKIREDTSTSIKLRDQDDDTALVIIRGVPHNVKAASTEIKRLTAESPCMFSKDIHINDGAWTSVVGPNGSAVRYISHASKATLTVKWSPHDDSSKNCITVRGTREQIDHAVSLIDERVAQGNVHQSKTIGTAGRYVLENILPNVHNSITQETFQTTGADGYSQVFVSAIQTPSHFWVQLCGPRSVQLDKLISEMTDFYDDTGRRSLYCMQSVIPGDLVAAYFDGDRDWYRALVLSVEKLSMRVAATVLFVDFGDSAVVELDMLCKLKSEYLCLPMQAIKCCLEGVSPLGERWSLEAIEMFERLTLLAQWKVIMAKPTDLSDSIVNSNDNSDARHDITHVKLVDTNGAEDIDIAEELVRANFAVYCSSS